PPEFFTLSKIKRTHSIMKSKVVHRLLILLTILAIMGGCKKNNDGASTGSTPVSTTPGAASFTATVNETTLHADSVTAALDIDSTNNYRAFTVFGYMTPTFIFPWCFDETLSTNISNMNYNS